jgi:putative ABC transport system permease protein
MLKNYFRIAFRSLFKNRVYSLINITGLAVGMAVAILIGLWMRDELSFNQSFPQHARIARVMVNVTNNGETGTQENTAPPFGNA